MNTFSLRIYEADDTFLTGQAEMVVIPTVDGDYGVMAGHENMVVSVVPGKLAYRLAGQETRYAFVASGMMRIEDNEVLILTEAAEHPEEIDMVLAKRKEAAAREAILQKRSIQEYTLAQATLIRAINRMRVKNDTGSGMN
ncbi:MAG: ATP synthase F1 subunit epsilon [Eubacterium sp.]|nr:ATP synthase F1 subunit epsilon [Eubacterium sp.]